MVDDCACRGVSNKSIFVSCSAMDAEHGSTPNDCRHSKVDVGSKRPNLVAKRTRVDDRITEVCRPVSGAQLAGDDLLDCERVQRHAWLSTSEGAGVDEVDMCSKEGSLILGNRRKNEEMKSWSDLLG